MNVNGIVKKYLVENGCDGLCDDNGCGCVIANLMPCDRRCEQCVPGYNHPELAVENETDFWMTPEKSVSEAKTPCKCEVCRICM